MAEPTSPQHTIVVPASIPMVGLLGSHDEFLSLIEREFGADIHVRGNHITVTGQSAEIALIERVIDELVAMVRTGQG
jgi:phosphate starvation-inducible PhoH-like protein